MILILGGESWRRGGNKRIFFSPFYMATVGDFRRLFLRQIISCNNIITHLLLFCRCRPCSHCLKLTENRADGGTCLEEQSMKTDPDNSIDFLRRFSQIVVAWEMVTFQTCGSQHKDSKFSKLCLQLIKLRYIFVRTVRSGHEKLLSWGGNFYNAMGSHGGAWFIRRYRKVHSLSSVHLLILLPLHYSPL